MNKPNTPQKKTNKHRLPPQDIVLVCDTHGFTLGKFVRAQESGGYIYKGKCGCALNMGRFLVETQPGVIRELKFDSIPKGAPKDESTDKN